MALRVLACLLLVAFLTAPGLSDVRAWNGGPAINCAPPAIPVCPTRVVPLGDPCQACEVCPLFPPRPPVVAPVIVCPWLVVDPYAAYSRVAMPMPVKAKKPIGSKNHRTPASPSKKIPTMAPMR